MGRNKNAYPASRTATGLNKGQNQGLKFTICCYRPLGKIKRHGSSSQFLLQLSNGIVFRLWIVVQRSLLGISALHVCCGILYEPLFARC